MGLPPFVLMVHSLSVPSVRLRAVIVGYYFGLTHLVYGKDCDLHSCGFRTNEDSCFHSLNIDATDQGRNR